MRSAPATSRDSSVPSAAECGGASHRAGPQCANPHCLGLVYIDGAAVPYRSIGVAVMLVRFVLPHTMRVSGRAGFKSASAVHCEVCCGVKCSVACGCSLMEVVMALVDLVGSYDMPAKAREKADRCRAEVAKLQEKERRKELAENLQKKKVARKVPSPPPHPSC